MINSNKLDLTAPSLKKIAIVGTACQGKTTLIKDMMERWPQLTTPEKTYRDIVKEKKLPINQQATQESQETILNFLIDQVMENCGRKKIVFDRCPLDNLIYTLWLNIKFPERVNDEFVKKTIALTKQSMKFLDAIFFIPLTRVHKVPLVADELRNIDPAFIEEIDNLFKVVIDTQKISAGTYFPLEDCPPVIEIFGERQQRIKMLELYINDDCNFAGEDDAVLSESDIATRALEIDQLKQQLGITNKKK
jgi:hypothetical protein